MESANTNAINVHDSTTHKATPSTHQHCMSRTRPDWRSCFFGARSRKLCWRQCLSVNALYSGMPCWRCSDAPGEYTELYVCLPTNAVLTVMRANMAPG